MMRRALWLGAGVALGTGGTLWGRRRLVRVGRRLRPDRMAVELAGGVEDRLRGVAGTVRDAVETGRADARRREMALRGGLPADHVV
jgi:hypothetical protein